MLLEKEIDIVAFDVFEYCAESTQRKKTVRTRVMDVSVVLRVGVDFEHVE